MNTLPKDSELKAFIYQQVAEVQPHLPENSQVAVVVQHIAKNTDEAKALTEDFADVKGTDDGYVVTLATQVDNQVVEFKSYDADFFNAVGKAKEAMISQLSDWKADEDRESKLRVPLHPGQFLIH